MPQNVLLHGKLEVKNARPRHDPRHRLALRQRRIRRAACTRCVLSAGWLRRRRDQQRVVGGRSGALRAQARDDQVLGRSRVPLSAVARRSRLNCVQGRGRCFHVPRKHADAAMWEHPLSPPQGGAEGRLIFEGEMQMSI